MELAQPGDQDDPGGVAIDTVFSQRPPDLVGERRIPIFQEVAVMEGQRPDAVVAEPKGGPIEPVEIIQVQGVEVKGIAEGVVGRMAADMTQDPRVQKRTHSFPRRLATA